MATTIVDLGTAAPPSSLGGYTLTPFGADPSPLDSLVSSLVSPTGGALSFGTDVRHDQIGNPNGFYATWSHGYAGDVYDTTADINSITLGLPQGTSAFYFYAEPNQWADFDITATTQNGQSLSLTRTVSGNGGANGFGFYADPGASLASIQVTTTDLDFALGEFGIARVGSAGVPDAGSAWTLMVMGLACMGGMHLGLSKRGAESKGGAS